MAARAVCAAAASSAACVCAMAVAAAAVWGTATAWPDLIVAAIMASLFLTSAFQIVVQALAERDRASHSTEEPAE